MEVKAESDIICTSRNAVKIVNSIPADKPILFLPDINLGNYVKQQSGRENMKIWQGACIVHHTFAARKLTGRASRSIRSALVAAHPECPADVLALADFIGSTSAIIDWCVSAHAREYIVMTESGVRHSLERLAPHKRFYFVPNENCNCSECPYMKRNTLEKLRDCLAQPDAAHRAFATTSSGAPRCPSSGCWLFEVDGLRRFTPRDPGHRSPGAGRRHRPGDITTNLCVPADATATGRMIARESLTLAGVELLPLIFTRLHRGASTRHSGDRVEDGGEIAVVQVRHDHC